jgi:hypothetical protein
MDMGAAGGVDRKWDVENFSNEFMGEDGYMYSGG